MVMRLLSRLMGRPGKDPLSYSDEELKIYAATFRIGWTVVGFGIGGAFVIGIWTYGVAKSISDVPALGFLGFLGADLLVAAAAAGVGALFGFVFGIPRTLDPASQAAVVTAGALSNQYATSHAAMAANTNLERISDWLTTLLIGATLVQIKDIVQWVGSLGDHLTATGAAANDAMVPIIVIYYFSLSFLGAYLITRLYLTSAFQQTLGMLAGIIRSQPDIDQGKKKPPTSLDQLKLMLDAAVKSGTSDDRRAAMAAYDNATLTDAEKADPELNANVARILAGQIADGTAKDRAGDSASDLKNAIAKAAAVPVIKGQLKSEFDSGKLKTKNETLDAEIAKALAPGSS
jgi:hypothetical protein